MRNSIYPPSVVYPDFGIQSESVQDYNPTQAPSIWDGVQDSITFKAYGKTKRLGGELITISEKIDGTNGVLMVNKSYPYGLYHIEAGSRSRVLSPSSDNHGFYQWVSQNNEELSKLPHGIHYGEWYGKGIQQGYGMKDKKFMLFNRKRYENLEELPNCVELETIIADNVEMFELMPTIELLRKVAMDNGSWHVPGAKVVEGLILRFKLSASVYKEVWNKS